MRTKTEKVSQKEMDSKSKKSERTRALILKSALRHFSSMGYSATSVQDIVDEANFTKPTLYYYFSSKADLFFTLIEQALKDFQKDLKEVVDEGGEFRDILVNILLNTSKQIQDKGSIIRLVHYSFFASEKEFAYREKCFGQAAQFTDLVKDFFSKKMEEKAFESPFSCADISQFFLATLNHFTISQLIKKESTISRKRAELIIDMFMKGIQSR